MSITAYQVLYIGVMVSVTVISKCYLQTALSYETIIPLNCDIKLFDFF